MEVIIINGPAGVGKSTLGRRLATMAASGVCISGDALKSFVINQDPALPKGLSYVGGAHLAECYLQAGYERVIFEFVFEKPEHIQRFTEELSDDIGVHLLTLWAPLTVCQERELARPNRQRLGSQVEECWQTMNDNLSQLGFILDGQKSADEVLLVAEKVIQSGYAYWQ